MTKVKSYGNKEVYKEWVYIASGYRNKELKADKKKIYGEICVQWPFLIVQCLKLQILILHLQENDKYGEFEVWKLVSLLSWKLLITYRVLIDLLLRARSTSWSESAIKKDLYLAIVYIYTFLPILIAILIFPKL